MLIKMMADTSLWERQHQVHVFQLENCLSPHVQTIRTSFTGPCVRPLKLLDAIDSRRARIILIPAVDFARALHSNQHFRNTRTYYSGAPISAFCSPRSQRCTCRKNKVSFALQFITRRRNEKTERAALTNFFCYLQLATAHTLIMYFN